MHTTDRFLRYFQGHRIPNRNLMRIGLHNVGGRSMMRVFKLVPFCLFSFCVFTQVSFLSLPGQVHAWTCCGCNCKSLGCCCPGQCGCALYQCRTTEEDNFQTFTKAVRDSELTNRQVHVRQIGECARRSWAMRVLGDAAGNLKLEPIGFDFGTQSGKGSVLQTAANAER